MINVSKIQYGFRSRVMMTWLAVPQESQSTPYVVGAIFLPKPHIL